MGKGETLLAAGGVGLATTAVIYAGFTAMNNQWVYNTSEARNVEACSNALSDAHMSYDAYKAHCDVYFADKAQVSPADVSTDRTVSIPIPANVTQIQAFEQSKLPAIAEQDQQALYDDEPFIAGGAVAFGSLAALLTYRGIRRRQNRDKVGGPLPATVSAPKQPAAPKTPRKSTAPKA